MAKRRATRGGESPQPRSGPTPADLGLGCLLAILTLVVYTPALVGDLIWDDDAHILNNTTLRSVDGLFAMWTDPQALPQYYPLVHTTFWLEYQLWGSDPVGYHVVNVLLHAGSAVLLWRILL